MLFENGEEPIAVGRFEKVGHFVNDDVFEEVLGLLDQLSVEAFLAGAVIAAGSFMWKHSLTQQKNPDSSRSPGSQCAAAC